MKNKQTAVVLGVLIGVFALLNLVGWWLGNDVLKGWVPGMVTMKIVTALGFLASCALIFSLVLPIDRDLKTILAFFSASVILFLMGPFVFSMFTGRQTGFESFLLEDPQLIPLGRMPGWPSIGTVVAFLLVALRGFAYAFAARNQETIAKIVGWGVSVIGALALVGYVTGSDLLYYHWGDYNAMAINTSVLFVLVGISLVLLKDEK